KRESVAAGNDPKGEARSAESSFPHHHNLPAAPQSIFIAPTGRLYTMAP
ncbi:hypothetical protein SEEN6417_18121, partial [Salmonella enterica subsp. enterica serovar Newport str. 637564_17]